MSIAIIAEIGASHEGELTRALRCIDLAAQSGATHAKFQLYRTDTLYPNPADHWRSQKYELPPAWLPELSQCAHAHGLLFGCSVFDPHQIELLRRLVDYVKISAYDLTYHALIREACTLGVPIVLSTAMATMAEIEEAVRVVREARAALSPLGLTERGALTLLHGVAQYPAPLGAHNLKAIATLRDHYDFPHQIGLSDHSLNERAAIIAAALGATVFERHFRLDDTHPETPDYGNAFPPARFASYCLAIRGTIEALGDGAKAGPQSCEMPLFLAARRSDTKPQRG